MKRLVLAALILMQTLAKAGPVEGKFIAHEWGTFTAVQGSNGLPMGGMSHEEETLPSFVVGRDPFVEPRDPNCHSVKGMDLCDGKFLRPGKIPTSDVTQKMETPVIYFHSDRERDVQVGVTFPNGIISQYYPAPSYFEPSLGHISALRGGYARFNVKLAMGPLPVPDVPVTSVYSPARGVNSNYLMSSSGQSEKFIFYRGLGAFTTDVQIESIGGSLAVRNKGTDTVSAAFLLDVRDEGSGFVVPLGSIAAGTSKTVLKADIDRRRQKSLPADQFLPDVMGQLNQALIASGLYKDEAEAMTKTWKNSYFRSPGLRVLYVLARSETDRLLPIQIDPQPQELVRTLVGRIEVLTDLNEASYLRQVENGTLPLADLGRFAEPKLRRLQQLTSEPATLQKIENLIQQIR